jgi:hypothetical protein
MHLMIDLETLSTSPQAAILSIGAVLFDPTGPAPTPPPSADHFYINVDIDSCIEEGLKIDGSTLLWWLRQSDAARKAIYSADTTTLGMALHELASFCSIYTPERVWATEDFDLAILHNAYNAVGQVLPWQFYHDRGLRTLKETAYPTLQGKMPPAKAPIGFVAHSAIWDAYVQALDVQTCYKQLGLA